MKKAIFLDINGVVCVNNGLIRGSGVLLPRLERSCLQLINKLCSIDDETSVIISSSWRVILSRDMAISHFAEHGLDGKYIHQDWRTVKMINCRGREILEWLRHHPEVGRYLIIDDRPEYDFLDAQRSRLVRPESKLGFQPSDFDLAARILHDKHTDEESNREYRLLSHLRKVGLVRREAKGNER